MNLKITSYIHGVDKNTISSINLIFLLDAKTIGTVEFKNDSCAITVYDNKEQTLNIMISNALYEIFGCYPDFKLNPYGEVEFKCSGYLPRVINFIKNKNLEYNFVNLKPFNNNFEPQNIDTKHRR